MIRSKEIELRCERLCDQRLSVIPITAHATETCGIERRETAEFRGFAMTTLSDGLTQNFSTKFKGRALRPGDADYDLSRRLWNGAIERRPAVIARCKDSEQVSQAVQFARTSGLEIAVRGGGHNYAGNASCDGGVMIHLGDMKEVAVDPAARRVKCGGGATWGDVDAATQAHGLATPGGIISHTGVAGLALGGGIGWLTEAAGLSCDNLLAAEVVTAEGRIVRASPNENPDLFWGLTGGGGNFGVVTAFEFRLHPVGTVLGGMVLHPLAHASEMLRFYRDFCATLPDEAEAYAALVTSPDGVPMAAMLLGYNGTMEDGERVLAPARRFGAPVADLVAPMSYGARQAMLDEDNAEHGLHRYWRSAFTEQISDELIRIMVAGAARFSSPQNALFLFHVHGAVTSPRGGNRLRCPQGAMGLRRHRAMERGQGKRHPHRLGARAVGAIGAASARQRLHQPHCRRRPAGEAARLVRRQPSAVAGDQGGIRPGQSVSGQLEHSAGVALLPGSNG